MLKIAQFIEKIIKKFLHFYISKCKIQNVRVQQHNQFYISKCKIWNVRVQQHNTWRQLLKVLFQMNETIKHFFPSVHPKGQWTRISRFYWSSFPRLFIRQAYVEVIKVKRTEHIQIRRYICVLDRNVKLKPGSVQNLPCFWNTKSHIY